MNRLTTAFLMGSTTVTAALPGCVRRTLTIDTDPQGATVHLNDQEIGATPASTDFTWYGDYDVVLRKPGYKTLITHVEVKEPWYQVPPIDFYFDALYPGRIHDVHHASFTLEPWTPPTPDEVRQRADELRARALADQPH
ncbi:MAG: PEGA domain-containing protein [Phycisphaerales bacterium]|nr:PEGA domain-containing protein [Phycisphaerales bacterium]